MKFISENKNGVEIGGPSDGGQILYKNANNFDNVVWSSNTVWYNQYKTYNFFPGKNGKVIINDATDISSVKDKVDMLSEMDNDKLMQFFNAAFFNLKQVD